MELVEQPPSPEELERQRQKLESEEKLYQWLVESNGKQLTEDTERLDELVALVVSNTTWYDNLNALSNITVPIDDRPEHSLALLVCKLTLDGLVATAADVVLQFYYLHPSFATHLNSLLMLRVFLDAHSRSKVLPTLMTTPPDGGDSSQGEWTGAKLKELCEQALKSFHSTTFSVFK